MAFIDAEKTIEILKTDGRTVKIRDVTDIGPAEGFDDFICFWRLNEDLPFFLIQRSTISTMAIEVQDDNS